MASNDTSLTSRARCLAMLEFVFLTIAALLRTVCLCVVLRLASARMRYESDCICVIGPFELRCWVLAVSAELYWLMEEHDVDPVLGLLALERANKINFGVANKPGWLWFNFMDSIVYNLREVKNTGHFSVAHPAVLVRYWNGWRDAGMGAAFSQAAFDRYRSDSAVLFRIPSLRNSTNLLPRSEQAIVVVPFQAAFAVAWKGCLAQM